MYGGTSKLGRGGGPKRMPFPPPSHHRASGPPGGRLSIGGSAGRGRNADRATTATPPAIEETFNLVSGNNPLAFAMIIRLAPDLVEEIKRVEAQGGRARMKFDSNPHNPNGNIIDVGGKEFRFTWSREFGDLCDIYEERQSGEDGNGLLVESGCAWRKVNVQRILDESTKNHVKMRSEEAERKLKSRKAIVLEPGNPSMKNQLKALAAVEATPWKNYNKKKEAALKKRKVETLQVGGPPKSTYKSGLSSAPATKGRQSSSPVPSPPEQPAASSPMEAVNISKSLDDIVPSQMPVKQDTKPVSEKEIPTKTNSAVRDTPGGKGNNEAKSTDLQSMLISLLMDKPSGMTLKALEKAVGDAVPNSMKKIEPIIKKIATYQAPGRYILKPGMDLETLKKPLSESGSSPEDNHHQLPAREEFRDQTPAPQGGYEEKVSNEVLEEQVQLNSKTREVSEALEKDDLPHISPDVFGDRKGSDHSEGHAGSSSDSGSDSDSESDSSDSGSDSGSHSRSRSRSPAGTGSGSSSDSESDASSNSKEASDEDVDIMTSDDEKESKLKTEASELTPVKTPDGRSMLNDIDEKQDGNESDAVEIEKDLPEEQEVERVVTTSTIPDRGGKPVEEKKPYSPDYDELQERQNYIGSLFDERENAVIDSARHEQSDSSERLSKGKHKRGSDVKNFNEKAKHTKKLKTGNLGPAPGPSGMDVQMFESSRSLSPVGLPGDAYKGPTIQMGNKADRQGNPNASLQKGYNNRAFSGKSNSDLFQSGHRSFDQISQAKLSDAVEKSDKRGESSVHSSKHSEKNFHVRESMPKDKSHRDAQNAAEKKVLRNSREGSNGSKQLVSMDSHYQKQGEMVGKLKEGRQGIHLHMGTSPKDNRIGTDKSPGINGRGSTLQRDLSDLELGELRESTPDETHVTKQFDRKSSFKRLENKANTSDDKNSDVTKVKPSLQANTESAKPSPSFINSSFPNNIESANKKRNGDDHFEDSTRSHSRVVQSHPQHLKADHVEAGSQISRLAESNSRFRNNETGMGQGIDLEGRGESNRRASANAPKQHDIKRGTVSHSLKESKRQISNSVEEMVDGGKDSVFADRNNSEQKRRESSSDENSCSYSKYEKDEPELKGPIKTFSQYKEYVQEYRDKYESYCSLNKILESHRNEFQKLGTDLESAKGRDMDRYNIILGQLKESYRRCGMRHKRLKRIFVVLHEELEQLKRRIKDYANT
ncbi:hypothetical protein L6164_004298 [Bauhinia variegata]|uniref:Uncharacterized protein n=1 Tax=Bauhinia variegata TaxID=167791 RepID=A0ACB9Q468_BAUVA|nr:hypothetical protein L6164_004298 [Bauhinia variegata]